MNNYKSLGAASRAFVVVGWLLIGFGLFTFVLGMRSVPWGPWAAPMVQWRLSLTQVLELVKWLAYGALLLAFSKVPLWIVGLRKELAGIRASCQLATAAKGPPEEEGKGEPIVPAAQNEREAQQEEMLESDWEDRSQLALFLSSAWKRLRNLARREEPPSSRQKRMGSLAKVLSALGWIFIGLAPVSSAMVVMQYSNLSKEWEHFPRQAMIQSAIQGAFLSLLTMGAYGLLLLAAGAALRWMTEVAGHVAAIRDVSEPPR